MDKDDIDKLALELSWFIKDLYDEIEHIKERIQKVEAAVFWRQRPERRKEAKSEERSQKE